MKYTVDRSPFTVNVWLLHDGTLIAGNHLICRCNSRQERCGCINENSGLDYIRGIEGATSNIYFGVFPELIKNETFSFKGRNRRPPLDPMNAMMSFIYTLLTNEVLSAIKTCGLDPYLGSVMAGPLWPVIWLRNIAVILEIEWCWVW
jgi:CRISPR associated protein Cas1